MFACVCGGGTVNKLYSIKIFGDDKTQNKQGFQGMILFVEIFGVPCFFYYFF